MPGPKVSPTIQNKKVQKLVFFLYASCAHAFFHKNLASVNKMLLQQCPGGCIFGLWGVRTAPAVQRGGTPPLNPYTLLILKPGGGGRDFNNWGIKRARYIDFIPCCVGATAWFWLSGACAYHPRGFLDNSPCSDNTPVWTHEQAGGLTRRRHHHPSDLAGDSTRSRLNIFRRLWECTLEEESSCQNERAPQAKPGGENPGPFSHISSVKVGDRLRGYEYAYSVLVRPLRDRA